MACPNPLKADDCQVLKACANACVETRELIEKCKACGIPMDEAEQRNNMQLDFAQNVLKQFFPFVDI